MEKKKKERKNHWGKINSKKGEGGNLEKKCGLGGFEPVTFSLEDHYYEFFNMQT